jgi:hypothetical protein
LSLINSIAIYGFKLWQALSGVLVMTFAARYLTPKEQGFYYTLVSLASVSLVFELGLTSVLTTASAREFIGLAWGYGGRVVGQSHSKFIGLSQYAFKWYACAALLTLLVILPLGGWYVSSSYLDAEVSWFGPWLFLIIATAFSLLPTPIILIVEGTGGVSESYLVRIFQGVVGGAATLTVLYMGGGLYAAAMTAAGASVVGCLWLLFNKRGFVIQIFKEAHERFVARRDLLSLQWRSAVSWLAGYAMVLMYVPLLFRTQGPVVSGQMALTMNVVNMTSVLAAAWMIGRLPRIATSIATKKWIEADTLFKKSFWTSIGLYVLGAFAIVVLRILLSSTKYDERVLSLLDTLVLVIGMGFYHASGLLASYLRAYLKEPMVKVSMIAAVGTVIIAVIITPRWGGHGIVWLVFFINAFFMFPATAYLYFKLRKEWQSE